ncbi:TPA: hypothetical protein EYN65_15605 [Candidatus Poribacteria bacterium]|nr:hypothetical protein [Candidatus Poribacteria bacterium]HIB89400.1 hypothetical protein [Candidatus Poribacteria bacterium]
MAGKSRRQGQTGEICRDTTLTQGPQIQQFISYSITIDVYLWVLGLMGSHLLHLFLCLFKGIFHGIVPTNVVEEVTGERRGTQ